MREGWERKWMSGHCEEERKDEYVRYAFLQEMMKEWDFTWRKISTSEDGLGKFVVDEIGYFDEAEEAVIEIGAFEDEVD